MLARQLINKSFHNMPNQGCLISKYSTKRVVQFISPTSQKYAPDGTGKHKVQMNTFCQDKACEKKDCNTPCEEIKEVEITGNYTHSASVKGKPQIKVVKVSDTDFNGKARKQHFAKTPKQKISQNEIQEMTENDITVDKKATKIVNLDPNILNEVK